MDLMRNTCIQSTEIGIRNNLFETKADDNFQNEPKGGETRQAVNAACRYTKTPGG